MNKTRLRHVNVYWCNLLPKRLVSWRRRRRIRRLYSPIGHVQQSLNPLPHIMKQQQSSLARLPLCHSRYPDHMAQPHSLVVVCSGFSLSRRFLSWNQRSNPMLLCKLIFRAPLQSWLRWNDCKKQLCTDQRSFHHTSPKLMKYCADMIEKLHYFSWWCGQYERQVIFFKMLRKISPSVRSYMLVWKMRPFQWLHYGQIALHLT